ncbi:eukaryotic translation initiation factor 3 subunit L [Aphis gossypii]|uniref:Eukaryotic translation initiation factor 3 subunit L n=1 Tax=Aphis gossypii TaxID=80765 RepID=A0A9P0NF96_APHGO|nr:eukaryotic translation initiation factor 3 subunit L [Aphis gossypii]CAH1724044.1 unnamed protein product [Aphis gossypii]
MEYDQTEYDGDTYYNNYNDERYSDADPYEPKMPEIIKKFLLYFRNAINEGMVYEMQNLYENTFPKLSDQYFDKAPWPSDKEVRTIMDDDKTFLMLYKELYYRHIFARVPNGPSTKQRFGSFYNYCDLFNYIFTCETPVPLELPDQWLWELVDEFVYQFQSFTQFRSRSRKSQEEIDMLASNNEVWNVLLVLNVLHSFINKSNIKLQLEVTASGGDPDSVAGEFGRHSLYKMLGYYSMIGLLRLHSLFGDYYLAIKVLENIDMHKKNAYSSVPACHISTAYYVGFAYMMMRRYSDAIRTFSSILLYIQRTKQLFQTRTYQNDQINKQTDQMYTLLAMCLVLHPQCVDESIQQVLREKNYTDRMFKMQYGDLQEFENCFQLACPKFLSMDPAEDSVKEAVKYQTSVFMAEVKQQKMLPTIRSYLKLYTTLPINKLVTFMAQGQQGQHESNEPTDDKENLTKHLLCFKHKMKNVVWNKGASGLDGYFHSGSELDFYIDRDMIHIADTKVAHRYGDFFIRKVLKFEELNRKLKSIKV